MPRQGGQGKGKPKMKDRGFGKSLIKKQAMGAQGLNGLNTKEKGNLRSILDNSSLDDFVNTAIMDGGQIEVKRVHKTHSFLVEPTTHTNMQTLSMGQYDFQHLKIPRKPAWSRTMTPEEVDRRERESFLQWRREIASMENTQTSVRATPFEKNLEVWRQLWRVIEKCDMAIQIVDARNPLLYYSKDLVRYAAEQSPSKPMMLILNKADFLSERQRHVWAQYLSDVGIKFVFYSARREQQIIDDAALPSHLQKANAKTTRDSDSDEGDEDDNDEEEEDRADQGDSNMDAVESIMQDLAEMWIGAKDDESRAAVAGSTPLSGDVVWGDETFSEYATQGGADAEGSGGREDGGSVADAGKWAMPAAPLGGNSAEAVRRRTRVITRLELIHLMTSLPKVLGIVPQARNRNRYCVGLVGFPNVGKSSVINTILGVSKSSHGVHRVGVSSTPGKTKHFQTLDIDEDLMLCDCPGLVFPSFMNSTADMLCSGILPINQMRDYLGPASIIASRVPQHLLEAAYGMHIKRELDVKDNPDRPPTASEFLCAFCSVKGYITAGTGRWDEFRACKEVLSDFNDGKILFVVPPPTVVLMQEQMSSSVTPASDGPPAQYVDMRVWLSDIEVTMARSEKVANRIAMHKLQAVDENSAAEAVGKARTAALLDSGEGGGMVFGGGDFEEDDEGGYGDFEYVDEADGDDISPQLTTSGKPLREHKRLKQWGKKNRKLREKNPYEEPSAYVLHTTNRSGISAETSQQIGASKKAVRSKRHDPHFDNRHEVAYVRAQPIPPTSNDSGNDTPKSIT